MANRLLRLLKHRRFDAGNVKRVIDTDALRRLGERVAASETHHSGQIRVCIEAALPTSYITRHATAHERAVAMFGKLRVWDTEHNNGVLIYLLLAEHAIEIVTDRGLTAHVADAHWQQLVAAMRAAFQGGRFEDGLNQAIDAVDTLLTRYFPLAPGQAARNEQPDLPYVR